MSTPAPAQPIQTRLAEAYHELPEAMRRIADALMSDPLLGALWGIESMADRAEVSVGTKNPRPGAAAVAAPGLRSATISGCRCCAPAPPTACTT